MQTKTLYNCVEKSLLQKILETSFASSEWSFNFPKNSPYEKRHAKIVLYHDFEAVSQDSYLISLVKEIKSQIHNTYALEDTEIRSAGISLKDSAFLENSHIDPAPEAGFKLLGLLNPTWKKEWGGGFIHDGILYDMEPGNFIFFDPLVKHAAEKIVSDQKRVAIDFYEETPRPRLEFYK